MRSWRDRVEAAGIEPAAVTLELNRFGPYDTLPHDMFAVGDRLYVNYPDTGGSRPATGTGAPDIIPSGFPGSPKGRLH